MLRPMRDPLDLDECLDTFATVRCQFMHFSFALRFSLPPFLAFPTLAALSDFETIQLGASATPLAFAVRQLWTLKAGQQRLTIREGEERPDLPKCDTVLIDGRPHDWASFSATNSARLTVLPETSGQWYRFERR